MMTQLAHVELGPSQQLDFLVVMRNHRDATADLRLFEVVHEIPLLYPIGGASPAEPAGTTVDGPCCPGVESALLCDLCCHFAIRSLMADAAQHCGHDPVRVVTAVLGGVGHQ